jgi:hypothetical protein
VVAGVWRRGIVECCGRERGVIEVDDADADGGSLI